MNYFIHFYFQDFNLIVYFLAHFIHFPWSSGSICRDLGEVQKAAW